MRWQHHNPSNTEERRHRAEIESGIARWWRKFTEQAPEIVRSFSRKSDMDLPAFMSEHLQSIHPHIMWEFGPPVKGTGHRLVITPENRKHLRPLIHHLVASAPALPGWEFFEHRLPEDMEMAEHTIQGRCNSTLDGAMVSVSMGRDRRIDLLYRLPQCKDAEDQQAFGVAFVATETLLGEELMDKWIGGIGAAPLEISRGGLLGMFGKKAASHPGAVPLERLKPTVDALIASVHDQMPAEPLVRRIAGAQWTLYKLEPPDLDDYPEQRDMFVGKTAYPEMWMAAHGGSPFADVRFTRSGETFCHVKLDGSQGLDEEHFADKGEIEDALDAVLSPGDVGCVIGGGTGKRYSYVDLALTDVNEAIARVRKRLQEGNVPRRSWIQFFDSYLCAEWIGVYDDSPPPPMPDFESE